MNEYTHRENSDGSFDSICMTCYRTIGNAPREDALSDFEKKHSCRIESVLASSAYIKSHSRKTCDGDVAK
jgi:hypothetical protein